jgi:nicotinate-nucleotide adenylyltransferase
MQKVAIFGGTFDPIHWGHLLIAETALSQLGLDRVIWVPAPYPPHKSGTSTGSLLHREAMVRLAIADHPAFLLSSVAANRPAPSYAIETLTDLQTLYPNTRWYQIVGLDAFQSLPRWYRRQELVPACDWLVAPRSDPGIDVRSRSDGIDPMSALCQEVAQQLKYQFIPIRWSVLQMPYVGVSSSLIRHYCAQERSIRYLVPDPVRIYIATQNLYREES